MRPVSLLSLLLLVTPSVACALDGRVVLDANRNGRADPGEQGIAGVHVSNGRALATTAADGRYAIDLQSGDTLFVIKPPGYAFAARADGTPAFWQHHLPAGDAALRYGGIAASTADGVFVLQPSAAAPPAGEWLLFGDPQPKSMTDVGYYARDIVEPIVGRHAAQFGITLGDEVNDDLSLLPAMNAVTAKLGLPWVHVAGNHDLDFDADSDPRSLLSFRAIYGPDTLAWEEPHATLIALDDVVYLPGQDPVYIGGLREDQFAFLEAYLPKVRRDRLLVIAVHVPFYDTSGDTFRDADRERLFGLLREFPHVLLLSSHSHKQQHYLHGAATGWHGAAPLHEYNVGAACGAFWSGTKDAAGIPDAGMADGTPNGYARLTFEPDGRYALYWHVARADGDPALLLHAPKVLRRNAYPAFGVYANVPMGMADSRVEYRIDGGDWQPMKRVDKPDPRLLLENARDDTSDALRGYDRSPEAVPSTHLWRGTLPTSLAAGEHRIEVRAFDRWRGEVTAQTSYRLDEAAP